MKFIELDKKIKKINSGILRIILFVSIYFRNLASNIDLVKNFPAYFDSYFDAIQISMTFSSSQITLAAIFSTVISTLFIFFFWEFIFRFYYELVARKIGGFMKREDFVFSMRLLVIFINLIVGIFALVLFFRLDFSYLIYFPIKYIVAFVCSVIFYIHLVKTYVGKEFKVKNTVFIAVPYFLYSIIILAFRLIVAFKTKEIDWSFLGYGVCTLLYAGLFLISLIVVNIIYMKQKMIEKDRLLPEDPFESGGLGDQYSAFSEFKSKK